MSRHHRLSVTLGAALLVVGLAACMSEPAVSDPTELRVALLRDSTYAQPAPYVYILHVKNVSTRALTVSIPLRSGAAQSGWHGTHARPGSV
jgi:hypothetical protein